MEKQGYVYIVTTARNGTLYVGVTSQLSKRVWEHKADSSKALLKRTAWACSSGTKFDPVNISLSD